ncbi:hypothetical protein A2T98_07405 [Nodularia spumigena CENA596]|uniref:Serine/threonine protein kinase n=1 Tax=Nodularia spumigena CENA596 TaxID=1819295 RepID=A0A161XNJ1_NODSP|nr:WD40 repeat domain-containing protein [Nodularia spumigena]KZL50424.1 hypothetical protein A2T98_07405 [Nodularia spumigena CENA596]
MPQNFAHWNVGDIILDLYKVTDILGEGGFGKVYKVRHQGWNIDLAVKILKLWKVATGRCLRTFEGHKNSVNSVCLSADSRLALSGSADNTLKLWEISTGFCLRTFKGHQKPVTTVCLSADSRLAISGSEDNTFRLWEISTGRCLRIFEGHKSGIKSVCWSADNHLAISGSGDSTFKLWEISTGRCLRTFEGHKSGIKSVCLSADNRLAMSASELDDTLKVWEISTGSCLYSFSTHRTNLLCLSADSGFALCCGNWDDFTIWILDWELELQKSGDWDEGARHYLDKFLTLHTPYAAAFSQNRKPSNKEITLALTRRGTPTWTEEDFQNLLYTLSCVGYGWLSPGTVHHQLEVMVRDWERRKPRTTIHYILPSLYVQTRDLFNQTRDVFQSKHFKIFSLSWVICILILSVFFLPPTSDFSVFIVIGILFVIYTLIKQLYAS